MQRAAESSTSPTIIRLSSCDSLDEEFEHPNKPARIVRARKTKAIFPKLLNITFLSVFTLLTLTPFDSVFALTSE